MLKTTLESHDSNRTIQNRPIPDSESPIQCPRGIAKTSGLLKKGYLWNSVSLFKSKPCPSFPWFFWFFLSRKTRQLPRIFCPCRTLKILGKDRENTKITKEIPRFKFTKEIQKTKEKKDWEGSKSIGKFLLSTPSLRWLGLQNYCMRGKHCLINSLGGHLCNLCI